MCQILQKDTIKAYQYQLSYAPKTLSTELVKLSSINLSITNITNSGIQGEIRY